MPGMWTLIRNGGVVPMLFIVGASAGALLAAFYFAVRGDRRTLGFVVWMSAAVLFATLSATCADVGATLYTSADVYATGQFRGERAVPANILVQGLAESTSPGILGFSVLAVTALLTAVGKRRLDERSGPRS